MLLPVMRIRVCVCVNNEKGYLSRRFSFLRVYLTPLVCETHSIIFFAQITFDVSLHLICWQLKFHPPPFLNSHRRNVG